MDEINVKSLILRVLLA